MIIRYLKLFYVDVYKLGQWMGLACFRLVCLLSALIENNVYCKQTHNKLGCFIEYA